MTLEPLTHSVEIPTIHIGERFRKKITGIEELAESIKAVGLLHPIVVNQESELIAGYRRLKSWPRPAKSWALN